MSELTAEELAVDKPHLRLSSEELGHIAITHGATEEDVLKIHPTFRANEPATEQFVEEPAANPLALAVNQVSPLGLATGGPTLKSEAYVKSKAMELDLLNGDLEDFNKSMANSTAAIRNSTNEQETLDIASMSYAGDMRSNLLTQAEEAANHSTEAFQQYIPALESLDSLDEAYATGDEKGTTAAVADRFAPTPDEGFSSFRARSAESENLMWNMYKTYAEKKSLFDKIINGTALVLAPDFVKDMTDLSLKLNGKRSDMVEVVRAFQQLDPAEKIAKFETMFPIIIEAFDDNAYEVGGFLSLLYDPNFTSTIKTGIAFDVVDIGSLVAAPLTMTMQAGKTIASGIKITGQLKKLNNAEKAAEVARKAALSNDAALKGVVIGDDLDIAMNASPFRQDGLPIGLNVQDGLSHSGQALRKSIEDDVVGPMQEMLRDDFIVSVGNLTAKEKIAKQKNFLDIEKLNSESKGKIYSNAVITAENQRGFVIQYTLKDEASEFVGPAKPHVRIRDGKVISSPEIPAPKADEVHMETVMWTQNDAGLMEASSIEGSKFVNNAIGNSLLSPETLLKGLNIVEDTTFGGLQASRLKANLLKVGKEMFKGTSRKERNAVDELLLAGDEDGLVYTIDQLRSGTIELRSGKRVFTDKEISLYYKNRAFMDELHAFKNKQVKDSLSFSGYKEIVFEGSDGAKNLKLGIPVDVITASADEFIQIPGLKDGKTFHRMADINVADLKKSGYQAIKLLEPINLKGRKKVNFMLVKKDLDSTKINNLPPRVLNSSKGYIPRVRQPGMYYVKDLNNGERVVRAFKGKKAADNWTANQMAKQSASNTPEDMIVNLTVRADQNLTPTDQLLADANRGGGLYTGTRAKDPILMGEDGLKIDRMSATEATQRYIDNISETMPLNTYRMALATRWKNTLDAIAKKEGKSSGLDDDRDWVNSRITIEDGPTKELMEETRRYMIAQMRIPDNSERKWERFVTSMYDNMEGMPEAWRGKVMDLASKDPITAIKGATFNLKLGWFNIRQLFVQAQNASLAIAIDPIHAPKALPKALALRSTIRVLNGDIRNGTLSNLGKRLGLDGDDLVESSEQFLRSGLSDSVLRTADFDAAQAGISNGTGAMFRKAASAGRIFYEEGEMFGRLVTWELARGKWKRANKGKVIDDAALREITDDTFRMHLNFQRENAAKWQTHWTTAAASQFMQVQAKTVGAIVQGLAGKGKWTRREAAQVFAGQLALYGTVGVPIAEDATKYAMDFFGTSTTDMNPMLATQINGGAIDVLAGALGMENQFGASGGILNTLGENTIVDIATALFSTGDEDADFLDAAAGPSLSTARDVKDATMSMVQSIRNVYNVPTWEVAGKSFLETGDAILDLTSTWKNASKIRFLHNYGVAVDRRGNPTFSLKDLGEPNLQTRMAAAAGFQMDVEAAYWDLKKSNKEHKDHMGDAEESIRKAYIRYLPFNNIESLQSVKYQILEGFTPIEQKEMMSRVVKTLLNTDSKLDKEVKTAIMNYIKSMGRDDLPPSASELIKGN